MIELKILQAYCHDLLEVDRFQDYCPNGLQVAGRENVQRLVTGVTASQALIDAAVEREADAILVHHGWFWRGEDPRIVGMKHRRLTTLLQHGISLLAYHLPLDAHPVYGNNAQLALRLDLNVEGRFGGETPQLGLYGGLTEAESGEAFAGRVEKALGRAPLHVAGSARPVQTVAWCSGAAQAHIEAAVELGVDAFLTGEASEQTVHVARECGIHFYAAGHHATERDGARALGEHLAAEFGLDVDFIDIPNPV